MSGTAMVRIRRGLDLPVAGTPEQRVETAPPVRSVALVGGDYVGLRPRLEVREGERVRLGDVLFHDKGTGVRFPSPGCGEVAAIHRGKKRRLLSVVVRLDGADEAVFDAFDPDDLKALDPDTVRAQLLLSGLWTALRERPFGGIPAADAPEPRSLFVTAIDTEPLAADPERALDGKDVDFVAGLEVMGRLADGPVRLCVKEGASIPGAGVAGVSVHAFAGPHPAGLPGTHIHLLDPVDERRRVWHLDCRDVAAIGRLFLTGRIPTERVIAVGGPGLLRPRLLRTRLGASIDDLLQKDRIEGPTRTISGSILSGRTAEGPTAFLGRYARQVAVLFDERPRPFLGWLRPGRGRSFGTALHGEPRALVPIGAYERVMPLDLLPAPLFRALLAGDVERAVELGCLELIEEDLALCSYVCPSKSDFGASLREVLTAIERE